MTGDSRLIEQLTYLMFIRSLDEKELDTEGLEVALGMKMDKIFPESAVGQSMRWSKFKDKDPREIYDIISQRVFPAIKKFKNGKLPDFNDKGELIEVDESETADESKTAFSRYMEDAMFLIPTPQVLQKIITGLEDLYTNDIKDLDMQGDLYEYMLGKLATAGQNGQFRTPRHIIQMMVELKKIKIRFHTKCSKSILKRSRFSTFDYYITNQKTKPERLMSNITLLWDDIVSNVSK